jgi:beta-mannosidase
VGDAGPRRATWFFGQDHELTYPSPEVEAELKPAGEGKHALAVKAKSLLRDLCLFTDRLDPASSVNEQLVTLLPGEAFTFAIDSQQPLRRERLVAPPVMQCANRFGSR